MSIPSRLETILPPPAGHTALAPLFWQRGEGPELITAELERMHAYGIDGVVVESRPHPDFLGPAWWRDLDTIVATCGRLGMRVWIFDDREFPTGGVAGVVKNHPAARKRFLKQVVIEAPGPVAGGRILAGAWLGADERVVAVVAARRAGTSIDVDSRIDLTPLLADGAVRWDVPAGRWLVHLLIDTPTGGEEWTKDHLNPVEEAGVDLLISTVYEAHREHYGHVFGGTVAGFFSDEPRFGNVAGYDAMIGRYGMVLPWGPSMEARLRRRWGADFTTSLPLLWQPAGETAARARHAFMDEATDAWRTAWSRVGAWCTRHGVEWTGHLVEDSGAHTRLGYGAGHFFRGLTGMHASGLDAVYQIWPGMREGRCASPFGDLDAGFFFWGIAKLASSCAHIDPAKRGTTLAECFGAYGWQHGLRSMLWLTNHLLARGVNRLVPHAWSMRFPDADCPPHFHALGHNPQSRHFPLWAAYAGRLCRIFSGGDHRCEAAVLYHAEAEWAGACQPFHEVLRALAVRQLDGDVMPADLLVDPRRLTGDAGRLTVAGGECYRCLVLPWAERQPLAVLERAAALAEAGVPVFVLRALPVGASDGSTAAAATALRRLGAAATILATEDLAEALIRRGLAEVTVQPPTERQDLRLWRYRRAGRDLLLAVNEDPAATVDATVALPAGMPRPVAYDPLADARRDLPSHQRADGGWDVELHLDPSQALVLIAPGEDLTSALPLHAAPVAGAMLADLGGVDWTVSTATAEAHPEFTAAPTVHGPGDLTALLPGFAGTVRYRCQFPNAGGRVVIDLGEVQEIATVRLNGVDLGTRLTPPYRFAAEARNGDNQLEIEVTTTLAPALGANWLDRAWVQVPAGLVGPVRLHRQTG